MGKRSIWREGKNEEQNESGIVVEHDINVVFGSNNEAESSCFCLVLSTLP